MSGEVALANAASTATPNRSIPTFLQGLSRMVRDPSTDSYIKWNDAGDSFIVLHHEDFAKDLLPRYYKHCQITSFVRQLNMYGFHKIPHFEDNGNSKTQDHIWEFSHPNFLRDQPDLLALVTRKKTKDLEETNNIDYTYIMNEIQAIKRHQLTISQDLKRIQADNQSLWQEQIDTRARHSKHQETIEKILTFLGTVYGNQYNSEDKSLQSKPKKRRLLLENDRSDAIEDLDLRDERTKETFEDMFRSASTSPKLRPLRQPATEINSIKPDSSSETRFTLPEHEARHNLATKHNTRNTSLQAPTGTNGNTHNNPGTFGSVDHQDRNGLNLSLALSPGPTNNSADPSSMQLTTTAQRMSDNDARTGKLEKDLAVSEQNLESLANLLGMSVADIEAADLTNLDPADLVDFNSTGFNNLDPSNLYNTENDFNEFMNPDASYAGTPANNNALGSTTDHLNNSDSFSYGNAMNPPLYVPGSESNGQHATINGIKSATATATPSPITSAPGSSTGSVKGEEEEIEEIDMERARGKKRKSGG